MTTSKSKADKRDAARATLLNYLSEGATVYTCLRHVAKSGMSRRISVHVVNKGDVVNLSGLVSDLLGYRWKDDGSIVVGGCGMDMGFHVVHSIGQALYGDGYKLRHRWL